VANESGSADLSPAVQDVYVRASRDRPTAFLVLARRASSPDMLGGPRPASLELGFETRRRGPSGRAGEPDGGSDAVTLYAADDLGDCRNGPAAGDRPGWHGTRRHLLAVLARAGRRWDGRRGRTGHLERDRERPLEDRHSGPRNSSPIVWGDFVFVTTAIKTGAPRHRRRRRRRRRLPLPRDAGGGRGMGPGGGGGRRSSTSST